MDHYVDVALRADISRAATAATNAAINEISRQADALMGDHPSPATPEWELAYQLLQLRIELAVGVDPLGCVVGLRRWGATWEVIAQAAGTSRQAAYERWGQRVRDVLDRYRTGRLGGPVADDESDMAGR